jgi:hypothetical protein
MLNEELIVVGDTPQERLTWAEYIALIVGL